MLSLASDLRQRHYVAGYLRATSGTVWRPFNTDGRYTDGAYPWRTYYQPFKKVTTNVESN